MLDMWGCKIITPVNYYTQEGAGCSSWAQNGE